MIPCLLTTAKAAHIGTEFPSSAEVRHIAGWFRHTYALPATSLTSILLRLFEMGENAMQIRLGIKVLSISLLALILLIPLALIEGTIRDRSHYRDEAEASIAHSWTGAQTIAGPFLVQPYRVRVEIETREGRGLRVEEQDRQLLMPLEKSSISGTVVTELRYRGIFEVPVYTADLRIAGQIGDTDRISALQDQLDVVSLGRPFLALALSDARGVGADTQLDWSGRSFPFEAGSGMPWETHGIHAPLPESELKNASFEFDLKLRGMRSLQVVPGGKAFSLSLQSEWKDPSYIGRYLPITREDLDPGFSATWEVSQFASNVEQQLNQCALGECYELQNNSLGVTLMQAVDVYLKSERATKYGILFIGLTFVAFFLFEILKQLPVHPIQYTLVGADLAIFYLLLLALSEHIAFSWAYLVSTITCVGLMVLYIRKLLGGLAMSLGFGALTSLLYGMLYVIIQAEDHALLMGTGLLLLALAIVMYTTRNIDWYQISPQLAFASKANTENHD